MVSDGELQVQLRHGTRESILDFANDYGRAVLAWQHEIGVPVLPLSAADETAPQLRHLLGQVTERRRR